MPTVTFSKFGLQFTADCDVEPYIPAKLAGPLDQCYPAEGGVEITSLTCNGDAADFLLDSHLRTDLEDAVWDALVAE